MLSSSTSLTASSARHVPPPLPLNVPLKYRRKSFSSELEDRPSSGTSSSSSLSLHSSASAARSRQWAYASTSASSSPVVSSPPTYAYTNTYSYPPYTQAHSRAQSFSSARDTARIRRHPSPPHPTGAHVTHHGLIYADSEMPWRPDLLDVDKPYSSSALSALGARHSRYAYGYAAPRGGSFAVSSDSEEPPPTSDLDVASGYEDDMDIDVDVDSESSPEDPDADDMTVDIHNLTTNADVFSPPRRRLSFSTSAERDKPYVRPATIAPNTGSGKRFRSFANAGHSKSKSTGAFPSTPTLMSALEPSSLSPSLSPSSSVSPTSSLSPSSLSSISPTPSHALSSSIPLPRSASGLSSTPRPLSSLSMAKPLSSMPVQRQQQEKHLPQLQKQLPTPPASSPEDEMPPTHSGPTLSSAPSSHRQPLVQSLQRAHDQAQVPAQRQQTPRTPEPTVPERRVRSRPTLMDLLSPSPRRLSVPMYTNGLKEQEDRDVSPFVQLWGRVGAGEKRQVVSPSSPLTHSPSPPMKGTSPLPDSSAVKESSPCLSVEKGNSAISSSSLLPYSSPAKASSPLSDEGEDEDMGLPTLVTIALSSTVKTEMGPEMSLPTPATPDLSTLQLPSSTSSSIALDPPSTAANVETPRISVYTPSPSQMPVTPRSPAFPAYSPSLVPAAVQEAGVSGEIAGCSELSLKPRVIEKEISPLRLDADGDVEVRLETQESQVKAVEVDVEDDEDEDVEIDELVDEANDDGMKTVTVSRARTPIPGLSVVSSNEITCVKETQAFVSASSSSVMKSRSHTPSLASRSTTYAVTGGSVESEMEAKDDVLENSHSSAVASSSRIASVSRSSSVQPVSRMSVEPPSAPSPATSRRSLTPKVGSETLSLTGSSFFRTATPASSSRALSPVPTLSTFTSLAVKHEDLLLSSPLSAPPSPLSTPPELDTTKDDSSDDEVLTARRAQSKKRPRSRVKDLDGPKKKRSRVEAEQSDEEDREQTQEPVPEEEDDAQDIRRTKAKAKSGSKSRGRKMKALSAGVEEDEEIDRERAQDRSSSTRAASSSSRASRSKPPAERQPRPRKRAGGRRKRRSSLSSSPEPHAHSHSKINWEEESPMPIEEIEGMIIETLATARATSLSAASIHASLMASRPVLKTMHRRVPSSKQLQLQVSPDDDGEPLLMEPLPMNKRDWLHLITTILTTGRLSTGVFGKVDSSASDSDSPDSPAASATHLSHKAALLSQWFYVPEKDTDKERAALVRTMMRGPGKRSETMKYKQYYWKPLGKISRWDPEDDL